VRGTGADGVVSLTIVLARERTRRGHAVVSAEGGQAYRPATPAQSLWSYPNLAGSVVAVADQAGVKQGATRW
jgi:hypothetical protein